MRIQWGYVMGIMEKKAPPGWWYTTYPSEKYEFASWGYYSQYMEK